MKSKGDLLLFPTIAPLVFIFTTVACMFIYTGGTKFDHSAEGYTFLNNFFSDLGRIKSWSGNSNYLSSALFCFACSFVSVSLIIYFKISLDFFHQSNPTYKYIKLGAGLGILAALHFLGIGFTPGDILRDIHMYCVYVAFGSVILTGACYIPVVYNTNGFHNYYGHVLVAYLITTSVYFMIISIGPPLDNPQGLQFQVISQKIIIYIMMMNMSIQGYAMYQYAKRKEELKSKAWLDEEDN